VVEGFRSIGHTSITHCGDRISTFIDLSQVEIPPYGQFQFVRVQAAQEVDHDAFEIYGIEKIKVVGRTTAENEPSRGSFRRGTPAGGRENPSVH
jgi:hypothetical protein